MHRTKLVTVAVLALTACRPGQPCPSCEDDGAELDDLAEETPDLPCDGADLQTDNDNCGECGNNCNVRAEGTDYEVGGCVAGACGQNTWGGQEWGAPSPLTCAEVCESASFGELSCQAQGCSELELTGFVCDTFGGFVGCPTINGENWPPPLVDFAGSCDAPIPWPEDIDGLYRTVFCCCG